jgi:hypothetical protein
LLDFRSVFFGFSNLTPERARTPGISASFTFGGRSALGGLVFPCFFDPGDQPIYGQVPVSILGASFLDRDGNTRRPVDKSDSGGDLIDMLAARSA